MSGQLLEALRQQRARDRSTRPRRVLVEKISAPHAEIRTAGVIIAVSTASAFCGAESRANQSTPAVYYAAYAGHSRA